MAELEPNLDALRAAVQLACKSQNASKIATGCEQVLALPRGWVVQRIEQVAADVLDLTDSWEYRRLLELATLLDEELVLRLVSLGCESADPDVYEAAQDFLS